MNEEFKEYFTGLGIKEDIMNIIKKACKWHVEVTGEEIDDVYISEFMKKDGRREYESLRLYSKTYYTRHSNFITLEHMGILKHTKPFILHIEKNNYDYKKATDQSTLRVHCSHETYDPPLTLLASGFNCDRLRLIITKYIFPHLK